MSEQEQVIQEYQAAARSRNIIRRTILFSVLLTIAVFVGMSVCAISHFREEGLKTLATDFQKESQPLVAQVANQLPTLAAKVGPVYLEQLHTKLNGNLESLNRQFFKELSLLEDFGKKKQVELNSKVNKIIENQESAFGKEIKKILGQKAYEDIIGRIAFDYREAMEKRLNTLIYSDLSKHIESAILIRDEAKKLTGKLGKDSDVETTEAFGIILEMLGSDLQEKK